MKNKLIKICVLFLLLSKPALSQWYKTKFVIGSFADPRVSRDNNQVKDSISFALAQQVGINLLSGPQFYNGGKGFDLMNRTLELANKHNMHVLVIDSKLLVNDKTFVPDEADKIIAHFKGVDKILKETMGGYSFGGEFPISESKNVKKWINYFKRNHPDKLAYTYLFPSYGFKNKITYEKYLDSYLNDKNPDAKPEVVAFDYYPFLSPSILTSYFYNLDIIKQKAGNRPFWYYIQSTTKKNLPDITDYQMKFMAYCPLAYGAKGAIYYTYESIPSNYGLDYHDALINPYGNTTKKYYLTKIINYYMSRVAGPIIISNSCVGTYHVSQEPTNEKLPENQILSPSNKYVKSISNKNILVGIFKNKISNSYFLMLVNKSSSNLQKIKVSLPKTKSILAYPSSSNYRGSLERKELRTTQNKSNTISTFTVDEIPAGEMIVIEVNSAQAK